MVVMLQVNVTQQHEVICFSQGCTGCKSPPFVPPTAPFDVEIHEMELCSVLKGQEEDAGKGKKNAAPTFMDGAHPEDEDEEEEDEEEAEEKGTKTQDVAAEEPRATPAAEKEKSDMTQ